MVDFVELGFGNFAFFEEIVSQLQLIDKVYGFVIIFDPFLFGAQCFNVAFGFTGIVPEVGCKGFFLFVCDFDQFLIDVKDTSSTHQDALQYL